MMNMAYAKHWCMIINTMDTALTLEPGNASYTLPAGQHRIPFNDQFSAAVPLCMLSFIHTKDLPRRADNTAMTKTIVYKQFS